ncbi:MAG: lamin tail domain-containing protein, partial [Cytophagales bacterium]
MTTKLLSALFFFTTAFVFAQSKVFFSEYIEGSSNHKALEIYNGTDSTINLFAEEIVVQVYSNGNANPGTAVRLRGLLEAGKVFVFAHQQFGLTVPAGTINQRDTTTALNWYNGDDAIVLRKGGAIGQILDVIGQIGFRPTGGAWVNNGVSTLDMTLRRKPWITQGDANGADSFDPSVEWLAFPQNNVDDLGKFSPVPLGSP